MNFVSERYEKQISEMFQEGHFEIFPVKQSFTSKHAK